MTSTPPPRRRRIAGERRRPGAQAETAPETQAEPQAGTVSAAAPAAPVTLTKGPAETETPPQGSPRSRRGLRRLRPPVRRRSRTKTAPTGTRAGWWGSRTTWVALVVALVVMVTLIGLGAAGMLGNTGVADVQEAEDAQVAAETAPSVAERAAEAILAYDYRSLDSDQAAAAKFMTGSFAEKYGTTFDRTVKSAARTYRAQVSAAVRSSSVIRAGADEVKVLLFVDQTTRSTAHRRPQQALNRVEFVMVEQDGEWLVDDISSY